MALAPTTLAAISLIALVLTIAIAFWRKMNPGIVAFGVTLIVAILAGIKHHELIKGFNSNLFIILLGAAFFATISQINGTLELLAKKLVAIVGKKAFLVPFAMFFVGIVVAASGPGTVPGIALCAIFAAPLSHTLKCDPLIIGYAGQLGSITGGMVPWCATGIVSSNLSIKAASTAGLAPEIAQYLQTGFTMESFLIHLFGTFCFLVFIYVVLKGWKINVDQVDQDEKLPPFNTNQIITLLSTLVMIGIVIVFKTNIGLTCFVIGSTLCAFGLVPMSECIKKISWGVILMVVGVGMLMHVVIIAGGIKLLTEIIAAVSNSVTVAPIISSLAGCCSWFSSTSGVVMPALIPTVPDLMMALNMTDPYDAAVLVGAIGVGSHLAGLSPASTGGGLQIASITNEYGDEIDSNKLFIKMFTLSAISVLLSGVLPLIGLYTMIAKMVH